MHRLSRGFTLLGLMIALALVSLILAVAIPNLVRSRVATAETAALEELRSLYADLGQYRARFQEWPSDFPDLEGAGLAGGFSPAEPGLELFRRKGEYTFEYHPSNTTLGGEWFIAAFQLDKKYRTFAINSSGSFFLLDLATGDVTRFDPGD